MTEVKDLGERWFFSWRPYKAYGRWFWLWHKQHCWEVRE